MASRFAGLRPSDQLPYLRCAKMLENIPHARRGVTVCSDPFLVFLLDFAEESKATEVLIDRSIFPETMSRPNDTPTGGGQVTRIQLPDVEYVYEEALVPQEDPLLSELPSKAHLLSSARQMWDNLTEDEREPYRFRAVLAALFPAALDQAF
ncbi:uncharacterized protein LOC131207874 [Anopheles bellator]|uniref:uncharacterized protein LOC131207874 n=1 Tax=Anopheles bellator TaxID=139047 RepID=UPI002647B39C|nr:uncharacterized protein LOC131207874 [Anopheles bellator]